MLKVHDIAERLYKKALSSPCRYKIAALALDAKGNPLAIATNQRRFPKSGGGIHAEMLALRKAKRRRGVVKEIWIIRLGSAGDHRPIRACTKCQKVAEREGFKIRSLIEV